MAKSPEDMVATMVENLKEKTGRPLPEWVKIAQKTKLGRHSEIVQFLKTEFGIGHGYANLIAQNTLQPASSAASGSNGLIDAQYDGTKANLRPIYDEIIDAVKKFGSDVEVSPKKTYVSLRRNKQFGLIQPSTATRIDVGINLKGAPTSERLEESGSFSSMVSHRVRVADRKSVDNELIGWLRKAYEGA